MFHKLKTVNRIHRNMIMQKQCVSDMLTQTAAKQLLNDKPSRCPDVYEREIDHHRSSSLRWVS